MKVFISWSGEPSRSVAELLHTKIRFILNSVETFMSKHDIDSGERWSRRINTELDETGFGIFCLTASNIDKPWIHFEAGAISKLEGRVAGLLIGDLKPTDFNNPLTQFQNGNFDKDNFKKLIFDINKIAKIDRDIVENNLENEWHKIESEYQEILEAKEDSAAIEATIGRTNESIVQEVLERTRNIEKIVASHKIPRQVEQTKLETKQNHYSKLTVQLTLDKEKVELYKDIDIPPEVIKIIGSPYLRNLGGFRAKELDNHDEQITNVGNAPRI